MARRTSRSRPVGGNAGRSYWVFGSVSGTAPGVSLPGIRVPLNPDAYTDFTIGHGNSSLLLRTRGTLDANGRATAGIRIPSGLPSSAASLTLHHAYVVFDAQGRLYSASGAVP